MSYSFEFNGSTLFISARSPFARRVRLALDEHGIRYTEKVVDLFTDVAQTCPELIDRNPLVRVPTLVLANGTVLIDSHFILRAFYDSVKSPLEPWGAEETADCYQWSGIATGLCEKSVEWFFETRRPENKRDPEIVAELKDIHWRFLDCLEKRISGREFFNGRSLTQTDLDLATALEYFSLRFDAGWDARYPEARRYLAGLSARPSLQRTRPPHA